MNSPLKNSSNSRTMCVSHIKDVDGCVSAALIKYATKSSVLLANYGNLNECLRKIYDSFKFVYVTDLGINETAVNEFSRICQFAELTYIDHHPISTTVLHSIQNLGVKVVHDRRDCAGVLTYNFFEADLPHEAGLLASYAAISDRLETGPLAKKLLPRFDRDFVLYETMLLSYALEKADTNFKRKLVPRLSKFEYPHMIPHVDKLAIEQAEAVASLRKELPFRTKKIGPLFYASAAGNSTSTVANLLIELCNARIGVGYETNEQMQITDLSIRGSVNLRIDLGKKVSKLAKRFGGTGGGHKKASGARIPTSSLLDFMSALSTS